MNITGVRKYEAAPREQITFSFQRSRPNLPVSLSVDGSEFRPVLNEFAVQVPADKGTQRRVVVMVVGEDNDLCNLIISGEQRPDGSRCACGHEYPGFAPPATGSRSSSKHPQTKRSDQCGT